MNHYYKICLSILLSLSIYSTTFGQGGAPLALGKSLTLLSELKADITASSNARKSFQLELRTSDNKLLTGEVNYKQSAANSENLMGEISGISGSSFHFKVSESSLEGNIILPNAKKAYKYFSDAQGNAYVKEVDINSVICIEYDKPEKELRTSSTDGVTAVQALPNLQSLPGAIGCVLLDFDGYYMPAGNLWNSGNAINAAPSGMSDAAIQESWEIVSEDFRPFNLNITTNESVFNSYPRNRRMRCVITPTNTAAPGAGGVAYIGSFNWDNDVPCWTFLTGGKSSAEASSHEIGHTFSLGHDGRNSPAEGYFSGHGDWATIMGVGYYKNISQWSKGEYNSANNTEDDLAKISGSNFGVGYRNDDHGNGTGNATLITASSNINHSGIIERTSDQDFFFFDAGNGTINLNINTVYRNPNLDIIARLYNSSGALIGTYNPGGVNASISLNVSQGRYYLSVDGTGAGNPATDGYSDYGSLGSYTITGSIPTGGVVINPTTGILTAYKDCNFTSFHAGFGVGDFTNAQLNAVGISNDDISSLKIATGYRVILYENDNFSGASVEYNSEQGCLVNGNWNDKVSSLKVMLVNPSTGILTAYKDCGLTGFSGGFGVGNFTNAQMSAVGIWNDDISSIKIAAGYKVILYDLDNFGGASVEYSSEQGCLVNANWNDKVSSLKVIPIDPSSGILTAYKDCSFTGFTGGFGVGNFTTAQLNEVGVGNDDISSIKITPGYKVILYDLDNFGGASVEYTSEQACLVNRDWNDKASSLKVIALNPSNGILTAYKHCTFTGFHGGFGVGNFTTAQMNEVGIGNDDISSIKIAPGYKVIIYDLDNFGGASVEYTSEQECLVNGDWNDKVSSLKVMTNDANIATGYYKIVNQFSGKVLDVNAMSTSEGAKIISHSFLNTSNQKWKVEKDASGFYYMTAVHSGLVLDIPYCNYANGTVLAQVNSNSSDCQRFKIIDIGGGFFKIVAKGTTTVLDGGSTNQNGADVYLWNWAEVSNQNWSFELVNELEAIVKNGTYRVINKYSGKAMGVKTAELENNAPVTIHDYIGAENQKWKLEVASNADGFYSLTALHSNSALDIPGCKYDNGTGLQQYSINYSPCQKFKLMPVEDGYFVIIAKSTGKSLDGGLNNQNDSPVYLWNYSNVDNQKWKIELANDLSTSVFNKDVQVSSLEATFEYYPNPAEDAIHVKSDASLLGGIAKIYDSMGAEVISTTLKSETVDVSILNAGMYILVINKDGYNISRRFTKL